MKKKTQMDAEITIQQGGKKIITYFGKDGEVDLIEHWEDGFELRPGYKLIGNNKVSTIVSKMSQEDIDLLKLKLQ